MICPVCQAELPDDFGLVDCSQCGAALYAEFDGTVRLREDAAVAEPVAVPEAVPDSPPPTSPSIEAIPVHQLPEEEFHEPPVLTEEPQSPEAPAAGGHILQDIADFGNSEESSARDGAYAYDLFLSGIDSNDLRSALKEAITDPLFLWDVEKIMREVKNGELKIANINAVKAALVVQRICSLPLKVSWVQHSVVEP